MVVRLADRGRAVLSGPAAGGPLEGSVRLWHARLELPAPLDQYLADHGRPVRYGYVGTDRPIAAYQTVFAEEAGSAEMPSAARPFTAELVTRLVRRGISVTPVLLHTGVSSQEVHEAPMPERFAVAATSAARINTARRLGGRVIAVGTTVVRALETVVDSHGVVFPGSGWTDLVISADREVRSIDGLITGWHEPHASHLAMIEAIAGRSLLEMSYAVALREGYLWHEFGDSQLILL
jgi:S-adenosylmethionine:tRNA ribosyltransferase-isomerase